MLREMRLHVLTSFDPFRRYWRVYGGLSGLLKSIYLYLALMMTAACIPFWSKPGTDSAQLTIDIVPSIMGFSLGGMAIVVAFSNGLFLKTVRQDGKDNSLFMKVIANFFHFLSIQTLAIASAMVAFSYPKELFPSGIAFFMLSYSLTTALAAAAQLFNISRIFNVVGEDT